MKDPEFISLLNLYVDREISPEDALRLESEVLGDPKRREVYDQYCRMQKACALLPSRAFEAEAGRPRAGVVAFPRSRSLGWSSAFGGLAAAAACAVAIVGYKLNRADSLPALGAAPAAGPAVAAVAAAPVREAAAMKAVAVLRLSETPADRGLFAADRGNADPGLNWMESINMPPVFNAAGRDLLKADPKSASLAEAPSAPAATEPAEMTAFRFQR